MILIYLSFDELIAVVFNIEYHFAVHFAKIDFEAHDYSLLKLYYLQILCRMQQGVV